jgi:hypothetical protein
MTSDSLPRSLSRSRSLSHSHSRSRPYRHRASAILLIHPSLHQAELIRRLLLLLLLPGGIVPMHILEK